jgi:hypothetical protein
LSSSRFAFSRAIGLHVLLTLVYTFAHLAIDAAGLPFELSVDWMWMADAGDLRNRLIETLYYYGAFPPGMNLLTGLLLKISEHHAAALAHVWFWTLGLLFANALLFVARAAGLSSIVGLILTLAFMLAPPSLYFAHLYHYEWPVAALLCVSAAFFYAGVRRPGWPVWLVCFAACAGVALTRSTFHPVWYVVMVLFGTRLVERPDRARVFTAALVPGALILGLCLKNFLLFNDFAVSTYGPSSVTLSTVAHLPYDIRDRWIASGDLSPFAAMNVYAPPREYAKFFGSPGHPRWPAQLTRLEHANANAPNYNHWWLLRVQRARRSDVLQYLRALPFDYASNVIGNLVEMTGPTTMWHPREGTRASPHYRHRWVLGGCERWFNRVLHSVPLAPAGIYLFLPFPLVWACVRGSRDARASDPDTRARGALLLLMVFQIAYVFAASTMLTSLEMSRYRYQIEAMIWMVSALFVVSLWKRLRLSSSS